MELSTNDFELNMPEWLVQSQNLYLVVTNATGDFIYANNHYVTTFLDSDTDVTAINFRERVTETESLVLDESLRRCIQRDVLSPKRIITRNRIRNTKKYKSIKWECSTYSALDEELIFHVGHDVVAMENANPEEQYSGRSLNQLFDDLQIGVVVQGADSTILLSNNKSEELLGLTKDQIYGRTVYDERWNIVKSDGTPFPPNELPATQAIANKKPIRDVVMGVFNPRKKRYVWLQVDANPDLDDSDEVVQVVTTFMDISRRRAMEEKAREQGEVLKNTLKEKTTLLAEIHHRVKNNLAIVSGLLELQSMKVDAEHKLPLQRSINRIQSIAMVHELMYQTEMLSSVNVKNYLDELIPAIQRTMQTINNVEINIELEDYQLNINQAIPLGLLMNELLTNSFKYAFLKTFNGRIDIKMTAEGDFLTYTYRDNGPGFKEGRNFYNSPSLGLSLINAQLEQLNAEFTVETKGRFELNFKFKVRERGPHSNM